MTPEIEAQFISRFIVKNRRERLLFELSSGKRDHCIHRFAHRVDEHFIGGCLHPYKLVSEEKLFRDMLSLGCRKDRAHIMSTSWDENNSMPLCDAITQAVYGGTLFVIAEGATVAYYEAEPDYASEKFLIY